MRFIISALMVSLIFSCGDAGTNEASKEADSATQRAPVEPVRSYDCYVSILQRDTVVACLAERNGEITGKLTFDNFEKDGSSGRVHGTNYKDTIKLWYDFNSEGMNSVMEVYFVKDGHKLLRGIGDIATKGDTAYFSDKNAIRYVSEHVFDKTDCKTIPEKFRCEQ